MADAHEGVIAAGVTITAADYERTATFYCEVFGFTRGRIIEQIAEPESRAAKMFQLPNGGRWIGRGVSRPELTIRIMQFQEPAPVGGGGVKQANHIGGDGFLFLAPDPQAIGELAVKYGGSVYYDDRTITDTPHKTIYVNDPDGLRIQVVSVPLETIRTNYGVDGPPVLAHGEGVKR